MSKLLDIVKKEIISEQVSVDEKWSEKYKKSINCSNPKGFSQRAHCQGKKKRKVNEDSPENNNKSVKDTTEPQKFPISAKKLKELINYHYPFCSNTNDKTTPCIGKINDDNCQTDEGVIYGLYSEKNLNLSDSDWSVVNRFDTNSSVHKGIWNIYKKDKEAKSSFRGWVIDNGKELFNGKYTGELVNLNKSTIEKGYKSESIAKKIIEDKFKPQSIKQHCAGDMRDRKFGQDLDVVINGISHYFQIKPLSSNVTIKKIVTGLDSYYEIPSYHKSSKYQEQYVDVIFYVDESNGEFVMFMNDEQKISTTVKKDYSGPPFIIRYYEEPISTNIDIETITSNPSRERKQFTHKKEDMLKMYDEKIKQLQDMKDKLLQSESTKYNYKKWLNESQF
jgi:hypothetical protein